MNADHDRDRGLDHALKSVLGRAADAPITPVCLDAETLAAWVDGGLDAQSIAMAEAHASNCARCQALIGTLARATPEVTASRAKPARLWRWWLAPLAAGAAAVTLWMVVPTDRYSAPPQKADLQVAPESQSVRERDTAAAPPVLPQTQTPATANDRPAERRLADTTPRKNAAKASEERARVQAGTLAETVTVAPSPPPPAAASAPVVPMIPTAEAQVALMKGIEITSTSSPSSTITWFVGREGVVLLKTDARTVTRVPFPETTDLTAVTATDDKIAVVTTSDGRQFRTDDGGKTWRQ